MTGHEAVQTVLDELVRGFPNEDAWTLGERALRRLSREQIERCAQVWLVEEVDAQRRRTARKTEEQHTRQRRRQPRKRREQDRERRDNPRGGAHRMLRALARRAGHVPAR